MELQRKAVDDEEGDPDNEEAQAGLLQAIAQWETEKKAVPPAEAPPAAVPPRAAPPIDTELANAQAAAKQQRSIGALGQAVSDFGARPDHQAAAIMRMGGAGSPAQGPKSTYWDSYGKEGDKDVADLLTRRKSDSEAELRDPNSQSSQFAQSIIGKFAPQLAEQVKGKSAEEIARFAPWITKLVTEERDAINQKMNRDARRTESEKRDAQREEDKVISAERFERTDARARENSEANRSLARASFGMRQDEVTRKEADDINTDVQRLGKELPGDVADFTKKYERIKAAMAANPGDIPGVGIWDSRKPVALGSKEDFDVQKDAGQMLAAYQKLITGTGASDAERANLSKISLDLGNEKSFSSGLESLKSAYEAKVKDVRARFRPEVVQRLEEGQRREAGPAPAAAPATGKVTVTNGTETLEIDAADLAEAKREGYRVAP